MAQIKNAEFVTLVTPWTFHFGSRAYTFDGTSFIYFF